MEYKVTKFFRFSKSSTPPNLFLRPVELASILFCYGRLWVYMGVYGCSWLFMVVHCCHGCLGCSCRSCPFVVAMDVCGCHGRSGRSWLFMAVHGCHGCSLPPWLPWLLMSFMPVGGCNGCYVVHARSWLQWMVLAIPYILAVPHISSYFSPCAALVDTLLSIFRHGTIHHHTVWDHRLSQG